jgi:hypothetical protein
MWKAAVGSGAGKRGKRQSRGMVIGSEKVVVAGGWSLNAEPDDRCGCVVICFLDR